MDLRGGFKLGDWAVYPLEGRLQRNGHVNRVQPKSMEVLLRLAKAGGGVVERDELLRDVWGERAVSDEPLTRCIGELRKALGDSRADPRYIRTIPKRGYQLLQSAVEATDESAGGVARQSKRGRVFLALGIVVLGVAALIAFDALRHQGLPADDIQAVSPTNPERSIAVLAFADMSPTGDQEYMSDGISEELLNLLARIQGLRVISRTSSFSFKDSPANVREIAEQLGVTYVLEGSVRTAGDEVRITAQLIDASTDSHVWSESYNRRLGDIFDIQEEIAAAVVDKLELTLLSESIKPRETNPEAYALFLQARYLHEHTGGDSFQRAFDYYEAALDLDPNYVPAWVWLAALYDDTVNSSGLPREEVGRRAREAIDFALEIEPNDPLALGMSGVLLDAWDNDLATAADRMQRALQLDPTNVILLRWSAILLNSLGRHEDAIQVTEFLFRDDPIGGISKVNLASTYLLAGRYDDAVRVCEIDAALNAGSGPCQSRLVLAHLYGGNSQVAFEILESLAGSRVYVRLAPMVLHARGLSDEYDAALGELLRAHAAGDKGLAYWLGVNHTFVGDYDVAMDWFEQAATDGVLNAPPTSAILAPLRGNARWLALMEAGGRSVDSLSSIELAVSVPGL